MWDTTTCEKIERFKLAKNARGVAACAISADCSYIAIADMSNDHNVKVFEMKGGTECFGDKGGPDNIYDLAFT